MKHFLIPTRRTGIAFAATLTIFILTACTSLQDRITASCQNMGYRPGTQEFLSCYQTKLAEDQQNRQMWGNVAQQGIRASQPPAAPAASSRPTNCIVNQPFNAPWAPTTMNCQ